MIRGEKGIFLFILALLMSQLLFSFALCPSAYSEGPFSDELLQAPRLTHPERASLAGEYGTTSWSAADLSRGIFSLPLGLSFPETRGSLIYPIDPQYSPTQGISVWGMGVAQSLAIKRYRNVGILDFKTDDLLSPWGHLVRGDDGAYYPQGIKTKVRVQFVDENTLVAFLEDRRTLIFGRDQIISTPSGVYAWYLVEAKNHQKQTSYYHYDPIDEGHLYLREVNYGGLTSDLQNRVVFEYEQLNQTFSDYRSTQLQKLKRRVKEIKVLSKADGSHFSERYSYHFDYDSDEISPAFYLKSIQKRYSSGESEPEKRFYFSKASDFWNQTQWKPTEKLNPKLGELGIRPFEPSETTLFDADQNGLTSFELGHLDYSLLKQTDEGFELEELPGRESVNDLNHLCRSTFLQKAPKRNLMRIRGASGPLEVVVFQWSMETNETRITVCSREGKLTGTTILKKNWRPTNHSMIADINNDGKPELIRVLGGGTIEILENYSTLDKIEFASTPIRTKVNVGFALPRKLFLQDLNGDGIPELVGSDYRGFAVWFGKGNYEFEKKKEIIFFYDSDGQKKIGIDHAHNIALQDLNQDGIPDMVVYGRNTLATFISDGTRFIKRPIPAFQYDQIPFVKRVRQGLGFLPLFADLLGSGNSQFTVIAGETAHSLELTQPETGLLKWVDDGKGNQLEFTYSRAKPEKGLGSRISVLDSLKVRSAGKAERTIHYQFGNGKAHSVNQSFLGFDEVKIEQGPHEIISQFLHEDEAPSLLLSTQKVDQRQPQVKHFENFVYDSESFRGVPFSRKKTETQGWSNQDSSIQASTLKEFLHYQDGICPSHVSELNHTKQLHTQTHFSKPNELGEHLTCIADQIKLRGVHPEKSSSDFEYTLQIQRDDLGNPLQFDLGDSHPRVLQKLAYNANYQLESIFDPAKGLTQFTYDAFYRLAHILSPDGTRIQVNQYHPLTDQVIQLSENHGSDHNFIQTFSYDGLERLMKQWDNLNPSSEDHPITQFQYHFANENQPGWIQSIQNLMSSEGVSQKAEVSFHAGDGTEIGSGIWNQGNLAIGGLSFEKPDLKAKDLLAPKLMQVPLPEIKLAQLFDLPNLIESQVESFLGYSVDQSKVYQRGILGNTATHAHLYPGVIEFEKIENGAFVRKERQDAKGQKVQIEDEAHHLTSFDYDALGRLTQVTLSNGQIHQVQFDDQGNVAKVNRPGIGQIEFTYYTDSGLLKSKTFISSQKVKSHGVELTYDHVGRKLTEVWNQYDTQGNTTSSNRYTYTYDENSPKKEDKQAGQIGFLTAVEGPDFTRRMTYRADGKLQSIEMDFHSWKTITQTFEYQSNGEVKTHSVTSDKKAETRVTQEWIPNAFGKLGQLKVGSQALFRLNYNPYAQVEGIQFIREERKDEFQYDDLTQRLLGLSRDIKGEKLMNRWNYNPRGLIESELFSLGGKKLDRSYRYSAHRLLEADEDELGKRAYAYDEIGLLKEFRENQSISQIETSFESWKISQGTNLTQYPLDELGRVRQSQGKTFTYGPHGRVASVRLEDGSIIEYGYDEVGKRILKKKNGKVLEAYQDEIVIHDTGILQKVKANGITVGMLENQNFIPLATDHRGSILEKRGEKLKFSSAYGVKEGLGTNSHSSLIEYASQGYDPDLGAYRMDHRDYDPVLKRFLTPDPLFLEELDKCVGSPIECNLYGYAAGNPISFVDPTGKFAWALPALAAGPAGWAFAGAMVLSSGIVGSYIADKLPNMSTVFNPPNVNTGGTVSTPQSLGNTSTSISPVSLGNTSIYTPASGPALPMNTMSSKIDAVIAETLAGTKNFTSQHSLSPNQALDAGSKWLGEGYKHIDSGVFQNADGTRQFRIDNGSITGEHGKIGPHFHLESLNPSTGKPDANNHIKLGN